VIVAKKAPRRASRDGAGLAALKYAIESRDVGFSDGQFADLVRWISVRPDPRHVALRQGPSDAEQK
jgi:hypothetical protein